MARRAFLACLLVGALRALLAVALPSRALASGSDGGTERADPANRGDRDRDQRRDHKHDDRKHDGRGAESAEAKTPASPEEDAQHKRRREQGRFALFLVGGALGVYVLYKLVRP